MISPIAPFERFVQEACLSSQVTLIVPEFDQAAERFREPGLCDAYVAIIQGAQRLLIVTVFERSYLARLPFSEVLELPFTRVVEMPVSGDELREACASMHTLPHATMEDRERFKKCYVDDWLDRMERDIQHRLKTARASLGALLVSAEPDETPAIGVHTNDSLRRGMEGLERFRLEVLPIDPMLARRVVSARRILSKALACGDARKAARRLAQLDQALGGLIKK